MRLWQTLRADVYRYRASTTIGAFLSAWLQEPGFRYTWYLRKVAYYRDRPRSIFLLPYLYHRWMLRHYKFRYGFDISPAATIGPGLYLGHFGGVVVSPEAVLGANVNVNHGVTIGATSRGSRRGAPNLGDRVWVGTHAVVVGRIHIGADALIAPGAYVNRDVEQNSLMMGNPAKCVGYGGSEGYINNTLQGAPEQQAAASGASTG